MKRHQRGQMTRSLPVASPGTRAVELGQALLVYTCNMSEGGHASKSTRPRFALPWADTRVFRSLERPSTASLYSCSANDQNCGGRSSGQRPASRPFLRIQGPVYQLHSVQTWPREGFSNSSVFSDEIQTQCTIHLPMRSVALGRAGRPVIQGPT